VTTLGHDAARVSARVASRPIVAALNRRSAMTLRRIPASLIPTIVMPIFFSVAFTGTFRGLTELPGFPTDNIWNWMIPYACVQSASFAAMGAAFGLGRDLETGFYDRLLMSPANRWVVPVAGVSWSVLRVSLPLVVTLTIGVLGGLTFPEGVMSVVWLAVASAGVAAMGTLWGMGVIYRTKKQSAGGLVQVGLFIAMFLSIGLVPLEVQQGWLPHVARWNPVTPVLTLARAGFVGDGAWVDIWPGLASIAGSLVLLAWWAARGMRTLTP